MAGLASPSPPTGRSASLIATCDQWVRSSHEGTAVGGDGGSLTLAWTDPLAGQVEAHEPCPARGMATDRLCRIYRLWEHGVSRRHIGESATGLDYHTLAEPIAIIGTPGSAPAVSTPAGSEFAGRPRPDVVDGSGIAIDDDDRLFLADAGTATVSVHDLWSHRLLRTIPVATPAQPDRRPAGLATDGTTVWAVLQEPAGLLTITATREAQEVPLPIGPGQLDATAVPSRIALLDDTTPVVLFHTPDGTGWLTAGAREPLDVGPASDIVVDADGLVIVAPCGTAGPASARRFRATADGWNELTPLDITGYDGSGLVVTRDGRIGYDAATGFRLAAAAKVTYELRGVCITYRLDSGRARNRWGRLFLQACVPEGTACFVSTATTDDEFETALPHTAATRADCIVADHDLTPVLPPERVLSVEAARQAGGVLHRRPDTTTPWWQAEADTFEAPVMSPPGRFLWVAVRLTGNTRRTPRIHEIRVEHHAHSLLNRLPAVYSHDETDADFLHRFLAPLDGLLHDLELKSRCRDILIDPLATPGEALDWLASFFGLVLDDRWAEAARRQLIAEIVPLYRLRGTMWSLGRYIEIYLAGERATAPDHRFVSPVIIEHFRLRGVGGPLLGGNPQLSSRSVLGHGFRVGGATDDRSVSPLDPNHDGATAFDTNAHRFTVLIPQPLGAEQWAAVRHLLDTERPAHTMYELCTVDAGMRAGSGLHLGISSIVGPTGAFERAVTGRSLLGRGTLLGGRSSGIAVEAGRLGHTTRVG